MQLTPIVSVTGVATSAWIPLDVYLNGRGVGLYLDVGAACTASVEVTPDNVMASGVTPTAWPCGIAALTGATADSTGHLQLPAAAVRINQTAGANTTTLKVVQAGGS